MQFVLMCLAVVFIVLGFVGFGLGGLPTLLFWILAAVCIAGAWQLRSGRQRRRENRS
jgi:uncharacterized membrane protein YbaN (DUF454 family)